MTSTTDNNGTALAVREMSLAELARRISLNVESGWGLQEGTPAQLNGVALFCQKHGLLPGDDVTLYDGRPWITVDGRVKLMRRHKDEYRGHSQRPLSKEEKEAWGWDAEDIIIETTVRTVTYGEMKAYGKVSKAERSGAYVKGARNNPVAVHHPVEMAQKRSLSRAERFTFGTDSYVDDEEVAEAAQVIIEQRADPERQKALAEQHDRIYGTEEDWDRAADAPRPGSREAALADPAELDRQVQNVADQYNADSEVDPRQARVATLQEMAKKRGIKVDRLPKPTAGQDAIDVLIERLDTLIMDHDLNAQVEAEQKALV